MPLHCPICRKEVVRVGYDVMDGWCLMYEEYKCGEHYNYYYETGFSEERIGHSIFGWSYNTELSKLEKLQRKIAIWIERSKYILEQ